MFVKSTPTLNPFNSWNKHSTTILPTLTYKQLKIEEITNRKSKADIY